jgi:ABC-type antimicrobial peptide transport system permease subunit
VSPLSAALQPGDAGALWLLQAAVGLILLIVCANVSNLLLVRASARRREFAIRAAIGAGRTQVVRQLLTESALLAALGGASGLLLAKWSLHLLRSWLPVSIVRALRGADGLAIDHRIVGFTAGLSLLAVLLFGVAPAMAGCRLDVMACLKDAARGHLRERQRFGSWLVSGELAMTLMLLIGAGLTSVGGVLRAGTALGTSGSDCGAPI